jgi:short-subunit dehydrogenase involved in D-alanine esterification of teichoic acids
MSLAKKLSLVTGSTSGIGLGIAKSLASKGSGTINHVYPLQTIVQRRIYTRYCSEWIR